MIIIVAAVIAAVFTFCFIAGRFTKKILRNKRRVALLKRVEAFASANNLRFSSQELLAHNAMLGVDGQYGRVLYMQDVTAQNEASFVLVDLHQVSQCVAKKIHRTIYGAGKKQHPEVYLHKVMLRFEYFDGSPGVEVPFYHSEAVNTLNATEAWFRAVQWQTMISKMSGRKHAAAV